MSKEKAIKNPIKNITMPFISVRSCSHSDFLNIQYTKMKYNKYTSSYNRCTRQEILESDETGIRICLKRAYNEN